MKHLILTFLLLAVTTAVLRAETIRFRSGWALAAELSTAKVSIANINPDAPPHIPAQPVYAVLSVKLDSMRSISIFDYNLEAFGKEFKCAAINTGKRFEFTDESVSSNKVIQLLFITDSLIVGKLPEEKLKLKCQFPPLDGTYDTEIPFTMLGAKRFSPISSIPAAGRFKSKAQIAAEKAAAEAAAEAARIAAEKAAAEKAAAEAAAKAAAEKAAAEAAVKAAAEKGSAPAADNESPTAGTEDQENAE